MYTGMATLSRPKTAVPAAAARDGGENRPIRGVDNHRNCDRFKGSMEGLCPPAGKDRTSMDAMRKLESDKLRTDLPEFGTGDTVSVSVRVREGEKERLQAFQGVVLQRRGAGFSETFTVRKVSGGIGVERVFPVQSPTVASLKVVRHGRVRRARIFFLRDRVGKGARLKERRT